MKNLILLLSSCLMCSQTLDTTGIATPAKAAVEKIVKDKKQTEKASMAINSELQKQIELMQQIKIMIAQLKNAPKAEKSKDPEELIKSLSGIEGLKPADFVIEIEGQLVQWEQKPRRWFGRLFSRSDLLFYPFIVDNNGNKIYIK